MRYISILIVLWLSAVASYSQTGKYLSANPKRGDSPAHLLRRFFLTDNPECVTRFHELNSGAGKPGKPIIHGQSYFLPIKTVKYNGKSIRTTLGIKDLKKAKEIEAYNIKVVKAGLKRDNYKYDKVLWLPDCESSPSTGSPPARKTEEKPQLVKYPIFGKKYENVKILSNKLDGCVYYLVSGHGGPDPGAIGKRGKYELHEDEYAYDFTLRLARKLIEHGALAYIIVQDPEDGIRDERLLNNSYNEFLLGGDTISVNQLDRLKARADLINRLHEENKPTARLQQYIELHVDSRYTGKRIDVFFYYNEGDKQGKETAEVLLETIRNKYRRSQPGRGYEGTVTSRSLYMLRNTLPSGVYVELGNIQNPFDQVRLIEPDNRQAVANWLFEGLLKAAEK